MNSSERYGIIAIAMLLLWGTSVTEPFRYFAEKCCRVISICETSIGLEPEGKIGVIASAFIIVGITLLMMFIRAVVPESDYSSALLAALVAAAILVGSFKYMEVDFSLAIPVMIWIFIIAVCSILKQTRVLMWITDCFVMALPVFLVNSFIFTPVRSAGWKISKFMFSAAKAKADFGTCFSGFLSVPFIVWGIFFAIMFSLPVVYFSFRGRKG